MASEASSGHSNPSKRYPLFKAGRYICGHQCDAITKVAGTLKNRGRVFYRCPYWQEKSADCGFFKWADERDSGTHVDDGDFHRESEVGSDLNELHHIRQKLGSLEIRLNIVLVTVFGVVIAIVFGRMF
ncbi:hypothetical protein LINGRAHAP2_LOCUS23429 [Linum grandiflorum]